MSGADRARHQAAVDDSGRPRGGALQARLESDGGGDRRRDDEPLIEDFYRLFLRKRASEREVATIGRASVLLVGVAAAIIARDPNSQVLGLVANA